MQSLSVPLPTNIEIIRHNQDNGTWPKDAIAVELKGNSRWLIFGPEKNKWTAIMIEPNSQWKRTIKENMTGKEATALLNAVLKDKALYKDNSRSSHIKLIKTFINNIHGINNKPRSSNSITRTRKNNSSNKKHSRTRAR